MKMHFGNHFFVLHKINVKISPCHIGQTGVPMPLLNQSKQQVFVKALSFSLGHQGHQKEQWCSGGGYCWFEILDVISCYEKTLSYKIMFMAMCCPTPLLTADSDLLPHIIWPHHPLSLVPVTLPFRRCQEISNAHRIHQRQCFKKKSSLLCHGCNECLMAMSPLWHGSLTEEKRGGEAGNLSERSPTLSISTILVPFPIHGNMQL